MKLEAEAKKRGLQIRKTPSREQLDKPITFREFVTAVRPGYRWYKHCAVLADVLQQVADGKIKRLMVFEPVRHGKSEEVSRLFSAYFLYRYPHWWVGLTSYGAELAYTLSRAARDNYLRKGGIVRDDAGAVKHWETGAGGGFWAAGVGGPITGKGFHLGIIDDWDKNAEEAASEVVRASKKEWYESTFYTREEPWSDSDPHGAIILIGTRWNQDDLAGWQLKQEEESLAEAAEDAEAPEGLERWHIVNLPAIKEEEDQVFPASCTLEPDWRKPGEALCPERRPLSKLLKIQKRIGAYFWSALFQQRPRPKEGGMFKRAWFQYVRDLPKVRYELDGEKRVEKKITYTFVRYWDKAGTEGGGKYTAGVLIAKSDDPTPRFYIVDVVRGQWSSGDREKRIRATAEMDRERYGTVTIWVEQEPGSGGKESAESTLRNLVGFSAHKEPVTGDKATRAEPLASQFEAGGVWLLEGIWNGAYVEELVAFPGEFTDQVDGSSGGFNKLMAKRVISAY